MTKDELLRIYNSPAYRVAKYNYVWKDDSNSLSSFWSNYENRRQQDMKDELAKANLALEKAELKKEQDAANKKQLMEDYQTASTKVANAEILWDAAVKEKGSDSTDARTAKNNLNEALWFKNHIAKQLGYEPNNITTENEPKITSYDNESSATAIENKAQDLANQFKLLTNPTRKELEHLLKQIGELETTENIAQETKNSLANLKLAINKKIKAINKAIERRRQQKAQEEETKKKIEKALKDWRTNSESRKYLSDHGYKRVPITGGKSILVDPNGKEVKDPNGDEVKETK